MAHPLANMALSVGILTLGLLNAAAAQDRPVERAIRRVDEGVSRVGSEIRQTFAQIREGVTGMSVGARVYGRIHWDKALQSDPIEVDVDQGSVVTLKGAVGSPASKSKAVQLAEDTVGVSKVVDQLTIMTRTPPNPPANPPSSPAR